MSSRVRSLLQSTANRESARTDLALTRFVFLIIGFFILSSASSLGRALTPIGAYMLQALFGPSVLLTVFLAVRLGGDSVGDVRCGLLELLFLSDTSTGQWLRVRVTQMWIAFLSVWIFRAPLLLIVFTLGGVRVETMLVSELLLMTGFGFLSSLALLLSFQAKSRRQVFGFVIGGVLLWEFVLIAPSLATGVLSRYYSWRVPDEAISLADQIKGLGLASCCRSGILGPLKVADFWPTFILYGVLSLLILARFRRRLRVYAGGQVVAAGPEDRRPAASRRRVSRRCWDDALAWQAFTVHGGGRDLVLGKCVIFLVLGLVMWFLSARGFGQAAFIISVATAVAMLIMSMNKAGDCLSREIKERTITMLLLTPNGPDEFYAGWQRGAWLLAWPDVLLGAGVTLASALLSPGVPPVLVAIGAGILSSGPFLMLSPLVPFSVSGIGTGVLLILGLMVIAAVSISLAIGLSPIAALVTSIPGVLIYNQVLRRMLLPYWMQEKLSSIV